MKRAQRLEMVQNVVDDLERKRAEALASSERRVTESEAKLAELESYHASYVRGFAARAGSGIDANMARDYQAFLGRLDEAIRQQTQIVTRVRAQRDSERQNWQGAAQRAEAVGQMVKRFQTEEVRAADKREQQESDERSARAWAFGLVARGA
ncbi:MAG: flagellar export protein FliJ [Proteobacteria bacterium]|nr:flagellar export protein FliJ [Pseudomonadota bacterium]